jgi:hypothetical protein
VGSFQQIFSRGPEDDDSGQEAFTPPPWFGPSEDELGACVPLALVVGRSEKGAVAIEHATVYSTGVELAIRATGRGLGERESQRLLHEQHYLGDEEEPSDGFLRIGIELADGSRASNLGPGRRWQPDHEPDGPLLVQHGGGGGGGGAGRIDLHSTYWLWPLPPPGTLGVFVEWPALDIALSTVELDAGLLLEAAGRSRSLWDS